MAKFLLLTHIYPPAIDGGSQVIAKIGEYLEKQGHHTLIFTSNCISTDNFAQSRHPNVHHQSKILSLPVITFFHRPFKLLGKIFPSFKTFSIGPIFFPFSFLSSLVSVYKFHPDYIIAGPLPTTIIIYARIIQLVTNAKLIFNPCFHLNDLDFQTPIIMSLLNKCDYLWCLTNYEKKYFLQKLKINKTKYFVHGLGVNSDFIIKENQIKYPKNPHLIFIANFSAHKKTELLIQVFDSLLKKYPQATLSLLGQKTLYFPQIEQFLKNISSKTRQHITFIFNPTRDQIKKSIDQSSCLILPSIHESFGLVFVESLARAKPIIGANTPQTSEVIKTLGGGLTFKADRPESLYKTICKLLESPKLSQKLAITGYQNVKNDFTWNRIGKKLCKKLGI